MSEPGDADAPFERFQFAQGGAVDHLETMAQAAREAAEDVLSAAPVIGGTRAHAQRLTQAADQCEALGLLVSTLDLPQAEDGV